MKEAPQITAIVEEGNTKLAESRKEIEADLAQKKTSLSDSDYQKAQMEAQSKLMATQQQYSTQMKQKVDAAVADKLMNTIDELASQLGIAECRKVDTGASRLSGRH